MCLHFVSAQGNRETSRIGKMVQRSHSGARTHARRPGPTLSFSFYSFLSQDQILFELSAKVESLTACTWGGRVLLVGC